MAEVQASGGARAVVGPTRAAGSVEVKVTGILIGLIVLGAAFVLSWAAEGATPRVKFWQHPFTELEAAAQDFHEHLATRAELQTEPVSVPVAYPERTAPGITRTMHQGFTPGGWVPVAPLPAPSREPW